MAKKKRLILTERDLKILKLIWGLKVCTTEYLALMFFPKTHPRTAYNRLRLLKNHGYLVVQASKDLKHKLWHLDVRGFNNIKDDILLLNENGFKSESPLHDNHVNVVQFGVFDTLSSKNVKIITEQELRRYDADFLPEGIPQFGHRPDGYWIFESLKKERSIVSIEVELSKKRCEQYHEISLFYDINEEVKAVVWVFNNLTLANRIYDNIKTTSIENQNKNIFIKLDDFIKNNTNATITMGPYRGCTLLSQLERLGAVRVSTLKKHVRTSALANMKLRCWN